jgi:hypothetical protein
MSSIVISIIHALDMLRPEPQAYFRGAVFIDEMFRRSESGPRLAMLNHLTDSKVFMQGVSNAVVYLTADVVAYLQSHDPTFEPIELPSAAAGSGAASLTDRSPFGSFRAAAPAKPLIQHELLPHEQIVAVQAAGQWLWAAVWLVDENSSRGKLKRCLQPHCTPPSHTLVCVQPKTSPLHSMPLQQRQQHSCWCCPVSPAMCAMIGWCQCLRGLCAQQGTAPTSAHLCGGCSGRPTQRTAWWLGHRVACLAWTFSPVRLGW